MNPTLYYFPHSPPSRCVLLLAQIIGIVFDAQIVDLGKQEQLTDSFRQVNVESAFVVLVYLLVVLCSPQINPTHTVPTIVDDGNFTLWESRAIMAYLTDSYAKNDSMYPHDLKVRALVDSRMQFDLGTLYPRMAKFYVRQADVGACFILSQFLKPIFEHAVRSR